MKKILLSVVFAFAFLHGYSQCAVLQSTTVDPMPIEGIYQPGTVVTFCYTVDSFDQQGTNWFHGVVLNFGPGWDTSSINVISLPVGCDTNGVWGYYPSDISTGSGETFGKGFYFDNSEGSPNLALDGIPGDNYGDEGIACVNQSWTFCFTIQVDPNCTGGTDLSLSATVTGDGTTGSWSNTACAGIPYDLLSNVACGTCTMSVSIDPTEPPCFGFTGSATAVPVNGTEPYSYSWTPGGQTTSTINDLDAGTYTVSVTDSTGCISEASVTITAPPLLVADAGTDTTICSGLSYMLGGNPTASGGTAPYQYLWNGTSSTAPNPVIVASTSTVYQVTVTDNNGCVKTDSLAVTVETCTGIKDLSESVAFDILPNPNNGIFTLNVDKTILNSASEIIVYDILGREVFRSKVLSETQTLNLQLLSPGVYHVVIQSDEKLMMKKMLKTD